MNKIQQREELAAVEAKLKKLPQQEMVLEEETIGNVYIRVLHIPADTLLTGKVHKKECVNILASGVIKVWTETEGIKTLSGFNMFKSKKGSKRVGRTFTDCVWVNIFSLEEGENVDPMKAVASLSYLNSLEA